MKRGDLWWAELPVGEGYEPSVRRPVVVISADDFNRSRIPSILAVVLTTNLKLVQAPGNVHLPAAETHLPGDLVANVAQMVTLEKDSLTERIGHLSARNLRELDAGLRIVLDL